MQKLLIILLLSEVNVVKVVNDSFPSKLGGSFLGWFPTTFAVGGLPPVHADGGLGTPACVRLQADAAYLLVALADVVPAGLVERLWRDHCVAFLKLTAVEGGDRSTASSNTLETHSLLCTAREMCARLRWCTPFITFCQLIHSFKTK